MSKKGIWKVEPKHFVDQLTLEREKEIQRMKPKFSAKVIIKLER